MTSAIEAIYDALAATTITVDSKSITVKDADELPNSVAAANLPVRLLTPLANFGTETSAISEVIGSATGSQPTVIDWTISDILLWSKVISNIGIKAHAKDLVAYCAQYIDMLGTFAGSYNVTSVSLVPDVLNYPQGSADWFYAVRAEIVIKEKFL